MYSKNAIVSGEYGLYGKSATAFIQLANTFKSTIFVEVADKRANAKSLLGVLSLAIPSKTEIRITAEGIDEVESVNQIVDFVISGCVPKDDSDDVVEGSVDPRKS